MRKPKLIVRTSKRQPAIGLFDEVRVVRVQATSAPEPKPKK